jgi:AraC family transcriptional regulator
MNERARDGTLCFNANVQQDSFGSELQSYTSSRSGVRICETLMPAGLRLEPHAHDTGQICFVLEGSYRENVAGNDLLLTPGMMHVRAPRQSHANSFSDEEDVLALLLSIDGDRWIGADFRFRLPARMIEDVVRDFRVELRRGDDAARAALEGLSLLTMARVARQSTERRNEPVWLDDASSLIARRFAEPLSLASLARSIGVRRGELSVAFRRFRDTSVGQSVRRARVENAKRLLATEQPLAEIAVLCGFHDQAHFTRVFRQLVGVTPGVYRARFVECK